MVCAWCPGPANCSKKAALGLYAAATWCVFPISFLQKASARLAPSSFQAVRAAASAGGSAAKTVAPLTTLASVPMGLVPAAELIPVLVAAGFPFDGPPSLAVSHPVHAALVGVLRSAGCQAELNQLIQRAAQTLSWPSQGVFYSTHSAKQHGRAFDLRVKCFLSD